MGVRRVAEKVPWLCHSKGYSTLNGARFASPVPLGGTAELAFGGVALSCAR